MKCCSEFPGALIVGWDSAETRNSGKQPRALPVGEKERFVFLDGSTHRQAVLVSAELGLWPRLREVIAGVQILIAKKLEQRAVKIVCARFGDQVQMRSEIGAILRRVCPRLHFKFLNGIDRRMKGSRGDQVIYDGDAIE